MSRLDDLKNAPDIDSAIEAVVVARATGMDPKELFGGPRDWVDQIVPTTAFVIANLAGGLDWGLWCAGIAEAGVVLVRVVKRETLRHAFSGAFGVAIAALIAHLTHSAKNFFLPGIVINAVYAVAFLVSALVGKPIIGYIFRFLSDKPAAWHEHPRVKRAYVEATIGWGVMSLARVVVQESLRRANLVGWLGFAKIAMGYPLYLSALALTKPYVDRRTRGVPVPESEPEAETEAETGGEDAAEDAP